MKNAIKYYYNMNVDEIHQINKIYKFNISNKKYILYPCTRTIEEIEKLYELQMYLNTLKIKCHKIIINNNNEIITRIYDIQYILINVLIENRKINIDDIIYLSNIKVDNNRFKRIQRQNWHDLWIKKIDYIEYQISQFGKHYPLIRESSDYYIGIVENCISLLSNINIKQNLSLSHERLTENTTTEEFYNPLNFIIDNRVRDISEYLKSTITEKNTINDLNRYMYYVKINNIEAVSLFTRILYPSKYFDIYEQIINEKKKENILKEYIEKNKEYEKETKKIYNYLRSIFELPEIEWLSTI